MAGSPHDLARGLDAPYGFFEASDDRPAMSSDFPVSTDLPEPRPDLEGREQRRARFARVVSRVMGGLGMLTLVALWRQPVAASESSVAAASLPSVAEAPPRATSATAAVEAPVVAEVAAQMPPSSTAASRVPVVASATAVSAATNAPNKPLKAHPHRHLAQRSSAPKPSAASVAPARPLPSSTAARASVARFND